MRVIIESTVGGNVAGYLQCTVSGDESISSLILNYCESKGIPVNPNFVLRDQKGATLDGRKTIANCGVRNGSTLFLELRGTQGGVFRFINWWYLALGAILVSIGGIAVVIVLHILTGPTPTQVDLFKPFEIKVDNEKIETNKSCI